MKSQNLPRNLRLLLGKYSSLTEGAHHIGINRQQLNKYLNGSSFPSALTLGRIAKALNVKVDLLFADPDKFDCESSEMLDQPTPIENSVNAAYKRAMERNALDKQALAPYCGDYLLYHRSASSDHHVHISLLRVYQEKQKTFAKSLMALRQGSQPENRHQNLQAWLAGIPELRLPPYSTHVGIECGRDRSRTSDPDLAASEI